MSIFDKHDTDILDGEVLRRVVKFANQSHGDLSTAAEDIQLLKRKTEETNKHIATIKEDLVSIAKETARQEVKHATKEEVKDGLKDLTKEVKWIKIIAVAGLIFFVLQFAATVVFYAYILKPELFDWLKL